MRGTESVTFGLLSDYQHLASLVLNGIDVKNVFISYWYAFVMEKVCSTKFEDLESRR